MKAALCGIVCVGCGSSEIRVVNSRGDDNRVYRRRQCKGCGARFTTLEEPVVEAIRGVGITTKADELTQAITAFTEAFSRMVELTSKRDVP